MSLRLVVACWAIAGCGGPNLVEVDAGPADSRAQDEHSDAGQILVCNAPAQVGCGAGSKCSVVHSLEDSCGPRLSCFPNGSVPLGGACVIDPATCMDDCAMGGWCFTVGANDAAVCLQICYPSPPSDCDEGEVCLEEPAFAEILSDVGLCHEEPAHRGRWWEFEL